MDSLKVESLKMVVASVMIPHPEVEDDWYVVVPKRQSCEPYVEWAKRIRYCTKEQALRIAQALKE